jgi:thiol:disulfide interchange protein DsbA
MMSLYKLRQLPAVVFALCLLSFPAAAQIVAGKDYYVVKQPQPTASGKDVEVIEFFYYGCPHCSNLQEPLETWLKRKPADVAFKRQPTVFEDAQLPLTRVYYALEAMKLTETLHQQVFAAIHGQKLRLNNTKVLFEWIATKGVDPQKFVDLYNSFGVTTRANGAKEITRRFDIPGTPAIVVDGRYLTAPSMTLKNNNEVDFVRYFQVLDQVVALARKSRSAK